MVMDKDALMKDEAFLEYVRKESEGKDINDITPEELLSFMQEYQDIQNGDNHYSKAKLDEIIKSHSTYLKSTKELDNYEEYKELYEEKHNALFVEQVEKAEKDIANYANGSFTIDDDAYESMEEYISIFGRQPKKDENGEFLYTPEALKALERLKEEKAKLADKVKDVENDEFGIGDEGVEEQEVINDEVIINDVVEDDIEREQVEEVEVEKLRSLNSDINEFTLDEIKLEALLELKLINQRLYDEAINNPQKAMETISKKLPIKEKQLGEFNDLVIDKILNNEKYAPDALPLLLADAYKRTNDNLAKEKDEEKKSILESRKEKLIKRIDYLTDQYASGVNNITLEQYNYDGNMNVADIYDGYVAMLEAREPDVSEDRKQVIANVRDKLDKDIAVYDEIWGINDGLSPSDNERLADNLANLTKQMEKVKVSDETLKLLGQIKFMDANGNPEPQFVDKDGNKHQEWTEGLEIAAGSRLETIVTFARNNTIIANLTADKQPNKEELEAELQIHIFNDLYAVGKEEQAFRNMERTSLDEIEDKDFNEIAAKVEESLKNPEVNWEISDSGYRAAVKTEVNNTLAYINRLGNKIGRDSILLRNLHKPIAKHDPRKDDRFSKGDGLGGSWMKTFLYSAGSSLAMKGVSYGAAKVAGVTMQAAAGYVAAGLAVTGMAINSYKYIKAKKAKGEKPSFKEFFFDFKKPYAATNAASIAGFAAGACMLTGNPVGAAICGTAGLGIMGYSTYKDARRNGASKKEAWKAVGKKLSAVAAGIATGSLIGSFFGNTPARQELVSEGTKGYTTHDYSSAEHNWAEMRNSDPRWSEFLQKYHVAPDLQNPADPNSVSADAMANLKAAITQAIGGDKQFYSDMGNGNLQPNTEMLAYKATQLLYLAPNPDAITSSGFPIGDVLGYGNPDGTTTNYVQALQQAISTGKVDNPQAFAQMLSQIENAVGGQIGDNVNDMGKITLFGTHEPASPVQSYNANADAGYNVNPHEGSAPEYRTIAGEKTWTVGFWEPVNKSLGKLKKRVGALADKLVGKKKKHEDDPEPFIIPPKPDKLMIDEYKIVYGIEPNMEEGKDAAWKSYCQRVEEERKASAPDKNMHDFLIQRREDLDKAVLETLGESELVLNADGKPAGKNYKLKKAGDNRDKAGVVMEARQSLMQSNLTKKNFTEKLTLSHFTKYIPHFIKKDEVVADGSRDISLNPQFKKKGKDIVVTDLNQYLIEGKPLTSKQVQFKRPKKMAIEEMKKLKKNAERG